MTPGYGVSQTPRGAPTPFVSGHGMDDDEDGGRASDTELPQDWLMTFPEKALTGVMLEFCVPDGETVGFSDGQYDGQTGVFVTRLDSGSRYARTVTVQLLQDGQTLGGIPYHFLTPVRPKESGDYAVCLDRSHSSFGKTATLSSRDGDLWMVEVYDENMGNPDMEVLGSNFIVKKHHVEGQ